MKTLMSWIVAHPLTCVIAVAAVSVVFCVPLAQRRLVIDPSVEGMMIAGPDKEYYEQTKETFGDDVLISVCIITDDVFTEPVLETVESLTDSIGEITLPIDSTPVALVSDVTSLTTVYKIVAVAGEDGGEGEVDTDILIDGVPSDADELAAIRRNALANDIFLDNLISRDGRTTAINIKIQSTPPGYVTFHREITEKIEELLDAERVRLDELGVAAEIFQIGNPLVTSEMVRFIESDMRTLVPLCFVLVLFILWFSFRSSLAIAIPVVTGTISVLWTLGFMAYMGYTINMVTTIIPLLLIVIGCTEDIHMLASYAAQVRDGQKIDKLTAVRNMAIKCGLAISLTSLTTILGFATLSVNEVSHLRQFGISAAAGLFFNFVITITVTPTLLRVFRIPASFTRQSEKKASRFLTATADFLCHTVVRRRRAVFVGTGVVVVAAVLGLLQVRTDMDTVSNFKADSPIRVKLDTLHQRLAGGQSFLIVVDSGREDGIKDPQIMQGIAQLQQRLDATFDKSISAADYMKLMNREMNNGDPAFFTVPDSTDLIAQYLLMIGGDSLEKLLDSKVSKACIIVRHNITGSWEMDRAMADIEALAGTLFPPYVAVTITGESILINQGADTMAQGQILGLSLAVVFIFIIISILFVSLKAGILAMIPNLIPILINFGVMGWFGVSLNPGTCTVAVICLGIAVDDTIHLMVRFHKDLKATNDQTAAMQETLRYQLLPVLSTSVALTIGFAIMILSNFVNNANIGYLSALAMLTAAVTDLCVTPCLMLSTQLVSSWDILRLRVNKELTETSALLHGLRLSEIKRFVLLGTLAEHADGETIVSKGDTSRELYLILAGRVEVVADDGKQKKTVQSLGHGDIFGEMAFVTGEERSADVVAATAVDVLRIDESSLDRVQARFPKIAARLMRNLSGILSRRLEDTTRAWAEH